MHRALRHLAARNDGVQKPQWLKKLAEPMDSLSLSAQQRLQDLTKKRDLLRRQLANIESPRSSMEGVEDPESKASVEDLKAKIAALEEERSQSQRLIQERKQELKRDRRQLQSDE
eukprot:TRINITY_DN11653_c0_g2_i5.p2 TRINITY_DN11653_c0_g2~~TRINITY_DN11653_c0_g2_i5.p2  ORF type:complete len:115 (-),score=29.03 TRINITY_DN11653_c0_g2_i5:230-574(-)